MDRPVAGIVPLSVAVLAGVLSWDLVRLFGNRAEAWDDPVYWQLALPLMLFTALLLGAACRDRPWRWVAAMVGGQAACAPIMAATQRHGRSRAARQRRKAVNSISGNATSQ